MNEARQRVAHVPREAVDEVVLAVRLVGDHHDVGARKASDAGRPLVFGEELVDGGEDHAAGGDLQKFPQVRAAVGLHRRLA